MDEDDDREKGTEFLSSRFRQIIQYGNLLEERPNPGEGIQALFRVPFGEERLFTAAEQAAPQRNRITLDPLAEEEEDFRPLVTEPDQPEPDPPRPDRPLPPTQQRTFPDFVRSGTDEDIQQHRGIIRGEQRELRGLLELTDDQIEELMIERGDIDPRDEDSLNLIEEEQEQLYIDRFRIEGGIRQLQVLMGITTAEIGFRERLRMGGGLMPAVDERAAAVLEREAAREVRNASTRRSQLIANLRGIGLSQREAERQADGVEAIPQRNVNSSSSSSSSSRRRE